MGKRCQVCDGPIIDGRCKYCGMPYRNDAELYHLNEDRSEHYRHASAKVRKAMRESEIPLPDRSRTVSGTTKAQNMNAQKTKKQTAKAPNIQTPNTRAQNVKMQTARTQTIRPQATARKTARSQTQTVQTIRTYAGKSSAPAKKKSKKTVIFWLILAVILALSEYLPEHVERISYEIENFINDTLGMETDGFFSNNDKIQQYDE